MSRKIEKIVPENFKIAHAPIKSIAEKVSTGNAILFVGSGFSRNAINLNNEIFPNAKNLAQAIGKLGKFDSEDDLMYASEKFLRDRPAADLIEFLENQFSIKEVLSHQIKIISAPWRRVYTTNYDMCVEESGKKSGKNINPVDLDDDPENYSVEKKICIHLNGSLNNLTEESINNGFKLSESSYLSADSFTKSRWMQFFKRDLEMCSAIIFVGYSLYDLEIKKILFENSTLSEKTFFITSPDISDRERFIFKPFGDCIPVGAENFSIVLSELLPSLEETQHGLITSIEKFEPRNINIAARDSDVERFLLYGDIDDDLLNSSVINQDGAPILVKSTDLKYAVESLKSGKNVAVISSFGNGKSVFLRSLKLILHNNGGLVYTVENPDEYNREDLEIIARSKIRSYIFLDSYDQHLEFLRHYSDLKKDNITLVLAARSVNHERCGKFFNENKINFDEFIIDELSNEDSSKFVEILDNVGFWGARAGLNHADKKKLIRNDYSNQFSLALFSLIQAPQIKAKISNLVDNLFLSRQVKDTIFAICVLSTLDQPLTAATISEVSGNNEIYSSALREKSEFQLLFGTGHTKIKVKSSIFALSLIRSYFEATYIGDQLLRIVGVLEGAKEYTEMKKGLLKFSSVERFFPERQKINNLVRYYEQLKRRIPWLKEDPHYWLQYAMAQLTFDDFEKSQRYLDQAYEFAKRRSGYHTMHIDMQQSKLFFKKSTSEKKSKESFQLLAEGIKFLNKVPPDFQKFRQAELLIQIYKSKVNFFEQTQIYSLENSIRYYLRELQKFTHSNSHLSKRATLESIERNFISFLNSQKLEAGILDLESH